MATVQAYKPMYKVRPYFVIKKVKLPDCMYLIKPLHKLPSLGGDDEKADTQRALEALEYRQDDIFSRIEELQKKILTTGGKLGLSPNDLQGLAENYVPSDTPLDVVISCPPSMPPYSLLVLYEYISPNVPTVIKSFVHSSAQQSVSPGLVSLFSTPALKGSDAKLKITIIWKEESHSSEPAMVVSPNRQTPVKGIANICRYLSRQFSPQLYESLPSADSSQIDGWLDSLTLSYLHGNAKEKASVLRNMNASLGSSSFLTGNHPTLADVVLYSVLGIQAGLKLGGNVKTWMKRCHGVKQMNQLPCPYLE